MRRRPSSTLYEPALWNSSPPGAVPSSWMCSGAPTSAVLIGGRYFGRLLGSQGKANTVSGGAAMASVRS